VPPSSTRPTLPRPACGVDGDITVIANLPKRVDWDQARLAAMVACIRAAGDDPAEYIETSFKVAERSCAAWPSAIREGFEPARTVRPGQLAVHRTSRSCGPKNRPRLVASCRCSHEPMPARSSGRRR
jgi:hypothetical protein